MTLIDNWRAVVRKAWSFRLALAATALSGAEVAAQLLMPEKPGPWLAAGAGLLCAAAGLARLVSQPKLRRED